MNWLEALVLGLVQGLTEFLPISSSAHLRIAASLLGWSDPGAAFTAVVQIGSELAVIVYFRHDIKQILTGCLRVATGRPHTAEDAAAARFGWFVLLGTIPIAVLGLLFQDAIEHTVRSLWLVGTTLIVFGLILGLADHVASERKRIGNLNTRDAILLGLAQSLALVPGVSRSGGTITAALVLGYERTAAARYSFLLALPAVLASGALEATKISSGNVAWAPTLLATLVAFAVGLAAIAWLMRYLTSHRFTIFVMYRVLLGLLVLTLVAANR